MQPKRIGTIAKKIFKVFAWIILSVILLLLLVLILIQLPSVQNFGRKKIVAFLEKKIGTPVQINKLDIDFPKVVVLEGVYFQDLNKDTLLAANKLKIDISLFKLLDNTVELNEISLDGITARIDRDSTGAFNFDYIINAFASKEPVVEDTTSTPMTIALGDINLDKIDIKYHDDFMGYDVAFVLNHFDTNIKNFDPEKLDYAIGDINIEGINSTIRQFKPLGEKLAQIDSTIKPDNVKDPPINLSLEDVKLSAINLDYGNEIDSFYTVLNLGKLNVSPEKIDIPGQKVTLNELALLNTKAVIYLGKSQQAKEIAETVANASDTLGQKIQEDGWIVMADKIKFENNTFIYDDNNSAPIPRGIDYSHLGIRKLRLDARSLYYRPDSISGTIRDFGFVDKSGVQVDQLQTDFLYAGQEAYLKDLNLETPTTTIKRSVVLHYPSIESLTSDPGSLQLDADLRGTELSVKDILYFVPDLAAQPLIQKFPNAKLKADVVLKGSLRNLSIPEFELSGLQGTHIKMSGKLNNVTDVDHFYADLDIPEIRTTAADINAFVPKGTIPSNITIPSYVSLSGKVKGDMKKLQTDLGLKSSLGGATVKATLANITDSIRAVYTAYVALDNFNVGKLIQQESQVGTVTMNANVNGRGYTPSGMTVAADGNISSAQVKGYNYHDLKFDASGAQGLYELTAGINDPNIDLDIQASANMNGAAPAIQATVMVDSISLKPLHFTDTDMKLHTKVVADIPNMDIDNLKGNIAVTEFLINTEKQRFVSDSIIVNAFQTDTGNALTVTSPVILAGISGHYTFSDVGTAFQNIINRHYEISPGAPAAIASVQDARFYLKVFQSPLLKEFVPDLTLADTVNIVGNVNSSTNSLVVNGDIPSLSYGTNNLGDGKLAINTTDSALDYNLTINQFVGAAFAVPKATVGGNIANNNIFYSLDVKDKEDKQKYYLAGNMLQQNGSYLLSLLENGLKLDYDNWSVDPQNKIEFGEKGIRATAFKIGNNDQTLTIASETPEYNAPLNVVFSKFKIESLTKIAEKDSLYMGGTIDGRATVSNLNANPLFDADINIANFSYKEDTLGNIAIKADNHNENSYTANVTVTGNGNSLKINGDYYTAGNFDFDINLEKLNLASIEGFAQGYLKQMSGTMTGDLKLSGTADKPKIIGALDFNQAAMNVTMLNSMFRMNQEQIQFKEDGIHFNNFTIRDSSNNTAIIRGEVYTTDYSDFRFNLDLNADNFQVVNSTRKDNDLYYGDMFINADIKVRGDMAKPDVNADLAVNDKTKMTFILPQTDPQVAAREGIIEFFDQDFPEQDSILVAKYDTLNQSSIHGLDLAANITIDKDAEFSVIIDEANGDFVRIKGEANLSGGIDASGKTSLTGTYELSDGAYEMSFNLIKRKFGIQSGSTITWTGEPTSANVDLTAVYVANAAPIDLVEQQLGDASPTIKNTYKQKLPFNVLLKMQGELMKPDLSFDIILPEKNYTVSQDIVNASNTRLTQIRQEPAELNKQVFALLLLNRFVSENPFSSSGGSTGVGTMAKQSVSRILSEQLNKFAADLITGVDVNFGLETTEDYTSGSQQDRTDLNVGLSKRLLNDRLQVSVGSSFELEGPQQANQKTTNIAGDIKVDYQLTKDGNFLIRAFRVDQYEVALQGQVVETGLTFIITMEYDKFREILNRKKEKKIIKEKLEKEQERLDKPETNLNDNPPSN